MPTIRILAVAIILSALAQPAQAQGYPAGQAATPNSAVTPTPETNRWGWFPKPKIAMPKVTMPKIEMPKFEMPKLPKDTFAPVKASAGKVVSGSKKAWEGAKEMLSFGQKKGATNTRVASRQQPSGWGNVFGGKQEPQGPRTIGEFMQGERPK
ncbi:MAG: hypothetical protein RH917_02520 [Lacipirellulaceae bacterium]